MKVNMDSGYSSDRGDGDGDGDGDDGRPGAGSGQSAPRGRRGLQDVLGR